MSDTCYACGQTATSDEHVPPKCIFPEFKDAHTDYRKNLITVRSCDAHNTAKSHDDEFLLFALVIYINNNKAGNDHFSTKIMRAVTRAPTKFQKMVQDSFPIAGTPGAGAALQFNRPRFDHEIEMIARALYFHHTGNILTENLRVESPVFHIREGYLLSPDPQAQTVADGVRGFVGPNTGFEGQNPDIFKYRLRNESIFAVEMLFYENLQVVATTIPQAPEPTTAST